MSMGWSTSTLTEDTSQSLDHHVLMLEDKLMLNAKLVERLEPNGMNMKEAWGYNQ